MLKLLFPITAVAAVFSAGLATAQTPPMKMECTQAEMDKMSERMKAMTDKPKQEMAMKEMKMADDMMKKKDSKMCMTHMENAEKAIGTKM